MPCAPKKSLSQLAIVIWSYFWSHPPALRGGTVCILSPQTLIWCIQGLKTCRGTSLVLYILLNICSPLMHSKLHPCSSLSVSLSPADRLTNWLALSHSAWNLSRCLCVCVCQWQWRVSGCSEVIVISQAPPLTHPHWAHWTKAWEPDQWCTFSMRKMSPRWNQSFTSAHHSLFSKKSSK